MTAREYFESIRQEVVKISQAEEMLERLKQKETGRAQSYEPSGTGFSAGPSDAIASRIDFEGRLERRVEAANAIVDEALEVLYGHDGRGGLAKLKGNRYADAICMAYLQNEPWDEIAEVMQCTRQWARKLCDVGFVYIDDVGWAFVKNSR